MFGVVWCKNGNMKVIATNDLDEAKRVYDEIKDYDYKFLMLGIIKFDRGENYWRDII